MWLSEQAAESVCYLGNDEEFTDEVIQVQGLLLPAGGPELIEVDLEYSAEFPSCHHLLRGEAALSAGHDGLLAFLIERAEVDGGFVSGLARKLGGEGLHALEFAGGLLGVECVAVLHLYDVQPLGSEVESQYVASDAVAT